MTIRSFIPAGWRTLTSGSTRSGDKVVRAMQQQAWDAGWWPERKRRGILWMSPDEVGQVMVHGTASDHRAVRNLKSEFRNAGLRIT